MNDTSGNSGSERNGRGPSGLPIPGPAPSTSDLRRRAAAYFDREMGPSETTDFQARLLADDRAFREFEMTRRAIEHLKTGRPAPDLTGSILDEVERRRRLLGNHRHTRRRLRNLATAVGSITLMAMVFFGVESVLPRMGGSTVASGRAGSIAPLVAVPGVADTESDPREAMALQMHSPVDASRDLRWDTSGSPLLLGAATDIGRGSMPIETSSWAPLGTSGVWPSFFPNASVSRPPLTSPLIDAAPPVPGLAAPAAAEEALRKVRKPVDPKDSTGGRSGEKTGGKTSDRTGDRPADKPAEAQKDRPGSPR